MKRIRSEMSNIVYKNIYIYIKYMYLSSVATLFYVCILYR